MRHRHQAQGQLKPSFLGSLQGRGDPSRAAVLETRSAWRIFWGPDIPMSALFGKPAPISYLFTRPLWKLGDASPGACQVFLPLPLFSCCPRTSSHRKSSPSACPLLRSLPPCWGIDIDSDSDSDRRLREVLPARPPHTGQHLPQLLLHSELFHCTGLRAEDSVEMYKSAIIFLLLSKNVHPSVFFLIKKIYHLRVFWSWLC